MARPTSKSELICAAAQNYEAMNALISSMTEQELSAPFAFDNSKKEAHWQRDKNLRDVLIHLYEWHRLLLDWVSSNMRGQRRPFLLAPYNWRTYGDMNMMFWKKHQNTTLEEAKAMLEQSHREVMELAETFTEEELFQKGSFQWVGGSTLASFFAANTASHYNWAMKKLKAHRKNCKNG